MIFPADDKGRRLLDLATVTRVSDDALSADDIVFSPFGVGVASGQRSTVAGQIVDDSRFEAALGAVSLRHSAAFYAYARSMIAFGYQLARDDRGERP